MAEVIRRRRKSRALTRPSSPVFSGLRSLNLTAGCAHGCVYCYARGYLGHPGTGQVCVYWNTLEKLRRELPRLRKKPTAVYFSTASDLFQPVQEALDLAYEVLKTLLEHGIGVRFVTKGYVPNRHLDLLAAHSGMVRAQIGVISTDSELLEVVEPHCPSPHVRLAQTQQLAARGIAVEGSVRPVLPGVTDHVTSVQGLVRAFANAGIKQLAADMLFLRPAVVASLKGELGGSPLLKRLLSAFQHSKRTPVLHGASSARLLPVERRRKTYLLLREVAADYGVRVRICSGMNPDITSVPCDQAGDLSLNILHTEW